MFVHIYQYVFHFHFLQFIEIVFVICNLTILVNIPRAVEKKVHSILR